MRSAADHAHGIASVTIYLNGLPDSVQLTKRPSLPRREVVGRLDRDMHDAQHRFVSINQGDVHRELAIALDEFPGAVQGVDQPETRPPPAFLVRNHCGLFRPDWNLRRELRKFSQD